jgi:hypothetical protein
MFVIVVLGVWTIMHAYVFWRAYSVPLVSAHLTALAVAVVAALLWLSFPLGMFLDRSHVGVPRAVVFVGATWLGVLFLAFAALLLVDVLTGGGYLFPKLAPALRGWALLVAVALAAVGLVQGLRDPVVTNYEVRLAGLPSSRDGLVLVELSDMHLGTLIGRKWMERQVQRVNAMRPDLVVVDGDLVDGNIGKVEPLLPVLKRLHAPLGVWAVTGNHEFYAGVDKCVRLFEDAGYVVLRDRSAEVVPGLVFAGVDDLTARRQFGLGDHPVHKALVNRPPGRSHDLPLAHAVGGRRGGGRRRRPDAVRPHPRRPDLAVRRPRPLLVPPPRRALPGERDDRGRVPRHRHVGAPHAPLAAQRDRANYVALERTGQGGVVARSTHRWLGVTASSVVVV